MRSTAKQASQFKEVYENMSCGLMMTVATNHWRQE
jgi:hypothetical protein